MQGEPRLAGTICSFREMTARPPIPTSQQWRTYRRDRRNSRRQSSASPSRARVEVFVSIRRSNEIFQQLPIYTVSVIVFQGIYARVWYLDHFVSRQLRWIQLLLLQSVSDRSVECRYIPLFSAFRIFFHHIFYLTTI